MTARAESTSPCPVGGRSSGPIGQSAARVDGPAKVTGQAQYAGEHRPPGLVYAATADSSIPAGTIRHIDTADA